MVYEVMTIELDNGMTIQRTDNGLRLEGHHVEMGFSLSKCTIDVIDLPSELRNKGIGSSMLRYMEDQMKKCGCTRSHVYVGPLHFMDPAPSEFYRKNGYHHDYPSAFLSFCQIMKFKTLPSQGGMMSKSLLI